MAITVLPQGYGGDTAGQAIGTGLGQGLQALAQYKFNDLAQRNQQAKASQFWQSLGLTPEISMGLAAQPEAVQKSILERLEGISIPTQQSQQYPQGMGGLAALTQQPQQPTQAPQQVMGQQPQQVPQAQQQAPQQRPGVTLGANPQERRHREQMAHKEKSLSHKQQLISDQSTKPYYDEINKAAKSATDNDKLLGRMEELIKRNRFGIPAANAFIKTLSKGIFGFGIDLTHLMNADAQELDKLSSQFIKGAKDIFPGRVTNADLDAFMRQIPNLSQTAAGMQRVINGMKIANESAKVQKRTMDEIIAQNNGRRPENIDALVEQRSGKKLDMLAKEFLNSPFVEESGPFAGILYY